VALAWYKCGRLQPPMYRILRAPASLPPPASDAPPSTPTPEEGKLDRLEGYLTGGFIFIVLLLLVMWVVCICGLVMYHSVIFSPTLEVALDCAELLWANTLHVIVHMLSPFWIGAVCYLFVRSSPRDGLYGWSVALTVLCGFYVGVFSFLLVMLSARIDLAQRAGKDLLDYSGLLKFHDIMCLVGYALGIVFGFVRVCARCGDGGKEAP
jgi:hypothetical protein